MIRKYTLINISREPIVKSTNTYRKEYLKADKLPNELRMIRSKFGFNYGIYNYGIYNCDHVLHDINKTSGSSRNLYGTRPEASKNVRQLSKCLESYIQGLYD